MKNMPIIYVDMDGVIADLDSSLRSTFNISEEVIDRSKMFKRYLPNHVRRGGFLAQDPLKNSDILIDGLIELQIKYKFNLAILTSAGQFFTPTSEVVDQKKKFLEYHFPHINDWPFCVTTSGSSKWMLAHNRALLIDDYDKNCRRFREAGGEAFEYSSAEMVNEALSFAEEFLKTHSQ